MLTILAIVFSALAFCSGLMVVGRGRHFQYTVGDILHGRDNALLYIWVTLSTMISMAHLTVLMDFGFKYHFGYKDAETPIWMAIHTAFGFIFILAHVYIKRSLAVAQAHPPRYLWGPNRVSAAA